MQLSYFLRNQYKPTSQRYIRRHGSLKRVALMFRIPTHITWEWIDEYCLYIAREWLSRRVINSRISGEMYQRACGYSRFRIANIALSVGADIHSINPFRQSYFIDKRTLLFVLKSGMDPNVKMRSRALSSQTFLYMAVMCSSIISCKVLLDAGADIHAKTGEEIPRDPRLGKNTYSPKGNESPLEYAIRFNKTNFIELFRSY